MDKLIHAVAEGGTVRIIAAVTTETVAEAVQRHGTSPTASAALGRTLTGTLLLGASFKEFDRLTVRIDSDGPIGGIVAESVPAGTVRGYVKNTQADSPLRDDGKFDVAAVVGNGTFYVIRESGFEMGLHKDPYIGSVPLVSGEIAEDFASYLVNSEQIPSAVMLGVLLQNEKPFVKAAGGVMVQMMPGANENVITMIDDTIRHAPQVTTAVAEGATAEDLIKLVLGLIDYKILTEDDIGFACNCSFERAVSLVTALGKQEVKDMLETDGGAVMDCGFCGEEYRLDSADLEKILLDID
ncbi:MAG: Hsp33 family molecular chaperone HslO [Pyrinomonadaceae bacterium]